MLPVKLFDGFDRIDFGSRLVRTNSNDTREPQSITAGVPVTLLDAVKGDFDHNYRLHQTEAAEILRGMLLEELRHFGDLDIRQSRIRLTDIQQLTVTLHSEGVVREHLAAASMTKFHTSYDDIEGREGLLPFQPAHAALARKI